MRGQYIQYSWPVSPYSAKTRAYLKFKKIPFCEKHPTIFGLLRTIPKAVGKSVMPTIKTPEGSWWQDSSEIIDHFEARFPEPPVIPATPKQRLAAYLLELHADEWLIVSALHYRWNRPKNAAFALEEFGRYGVPLFPRFLQKVVGNKVGGQMAGYLPKFGIIDATIPGLETYTTTLIAQLEIHLQTHPFLLGSRPCLADFSLFAPLWAHLYRDPDTTSLFNQAPSVVTWINRLLEPDGNVGDFLSDDEIPETLFPLFETLFAEQFPYLQHLVRAIDRYCEAHPDATRVPRALGNTDFVIGGKAGRRIMITFGQWMLQRPLDVYHNLPETDRPLVDKWLTSIGGKDFMQLEVRHPLKRQNFKEVLA